MGKVSRSKREHRLIREADKAMAERVRQAEGGKAAVVENPPGVEKMSEVLSDFARPLLNFADTKEDYRKGLLLATVAWNLALLPEERRFTGESTAALLRTIGPDGEVLMQKLIHRKLTLFADNTRPILDVELVDLGDKFHFSVISGLPINPNNPAEPPINLNPSWLEKHRVR